jgi:hypothetical protein
MQFRANKRREGGRGPSLLKKQIPKKQLESVFNYIFNYGWIGQC